jgi:AcrR family transcriptional regulator
MAPRAYNIETRRRQQDELKARIAAAAAELHAVQGALATSYAQIAERAGVSLPTVYKHYPELDTLVQACSGHVAAQAPAFPQERVLAAPDLASAAQALVDGCDAQHAHFEPWVSWREDLRIEALRALADARRRQLRALCEAVLARHRAAADARDETAALWETLLSFGVWQRLVREHKLSRTAARRRLAQLLLAAIGPQPVAGSSAGPKKRSSP